jgi:hypothetical protein
MNEPSSREIVERYVEAMGGRDVGAIPEVLAQDVVEDYPQSGERIVGLDNWLAIITHWPESEALHTHIDRLVGSEDRWVMGPSWQLTRVVGTGDQFWAAGHVTYPDGSTWHIVQLLEVRNGKIARMTSYFGQPFPAADWRRPYVQPVDPPAPS